MTQRTLAGVVASAALIGLLVESCGGSSAPSSTTAPSTLPSPLPSIGLSILSGETRIPVAGARVTVGAQTLTADANGRVGTPSGATEGVFMDIVAPGFLDRQTLLRSAEPQITLWPSDTASGLDANFTSLVAYSPSGCPAVSSPTAASRRFASSTTAVSVVFQSALQDAAAQSNHVEAIRRLNAASGGLPVYSFVAGAPSTSVVFTVEIDPAAATCTAGPEPLRASTTLLLNGGVITGGTLTYCTLQAARSLDLVLHELGHSYGLFHGPTASDVMWCTSGRPSNFSARETLAMALLRQRRPGNRWPDNDRVSTAALGFQEETIDCSGH